MNSSCENELNASVRAFAYPAVATEEELAVDPEPEPPQAIDVEQIAREKGISEGKERAWREYQDQLSRERESLKAAITQFHSERARYYGQVESEVVHLALAIARKVLHREAQVDKMLLAGVVQVALSKIEAGTHVKLQVNAAELELWRQAISGLAPSERPEVEAESALARGSCVLCTDLGEVELGLEPQLKEIENGILDLLSKRPE